MSSFTALNGASPKTADPPTKSSDIADKSASPDERPQSSAATHRSRASPEFVSPKEGWRDRERPGYQPSNYPHGEGAHKRKRSDSVEVRREQQVQERTPDTATAPTTAESRESYGTLKREHHLYDNEQREKESSWRDDKASYEAQQDSSTPVQDHTEEQIGDALRRATGQMDHSDYSQTSPDAEDRSIAAYGSPYGGDHRQDSILQHDPKKRKRNFSNRTKTGCLTCRKRKKKCDEQKPECSNCIRGGFLCAGYPPQRGPGWQKADSKSAAIPLESKDPSYVPPGAYGMPLHVAYGPQPVKREPLPHYRGQALRIDPPQSRSLVISDDDRPTASTLASASVASPENKLSAIPYTPGNAFPTPVSANTQPPSFGDRMAKEYQRVPPLHDLSRNEPETPHPGNALPQINILHPTRTSSPTPHPPPPPPPPASNAQVAAQLALSHSGYPQRRTQKEEMLSGRHYYPFDKELCLERERCAVACWRFNNLTTPPTHGVSPDERARLFLEILQPRDPVRVSPTEASPVTNVGRVGRHVAVETPFTCDYGYNITIGHHVVIGRNCTINDVCEVKIGDNCVIGPNVSIFTASLPTDPKKRQGGQGPQFGRSITIAQDCWIGGGAIILPGRTIGKGSTVGAGSIVTKDVPPFTVVAGNPARVLRGIGNAP
ncbi:rhamnolipids biosynthesis 3-oxoacyl-reductase [Purpureocillium lavendulum]|uniref:Rhamnolipids biosynthesis 3-oxoacyl-reductase n=1 Tax=Purpureocillium lavendulum TaxID=1247861 RepID=A0AB34FQH1_9HYPO|nr:rhamnolipids biosynthesis 3-oxoacyl-reductase [Purpureocillium lavendulum]